MSKKCKWYPDQFFHEIKGLKVEEMGLYCLIVNMIGANGGPIPDDPAYIARYQKFGRKKTQRLLDRLVFLQKITRAKGLLSKGGTS